ncbi:MAG TPA: hypothetical protein VHW44_13830 [Pseudonocardiaceae bacterium]|jgi:hypothetical protein|nr:hypothetical protein [Pseudonocardiaceae bacterium]
MNSWINLSALWQIVVVGLIAGAGLPALFAVGLRALSLGGNRTEAAGAGDTDRVVGNNPLGIALAAICFLVVLAAVGWGIYFIVAGS